MDDELKDAILSVPLYKSLKRQRLRMILEALDKAMHDPKTERLHLPDQLEIEHIMPQKWEKNWPLPKGKDKGEAMIYRNKLIDTIGNLTLLTQKLNDSISNGPWTTKCKEFGKYTILNLTRALLDKDPWDENEIKTRSSKLAGVAIKVWPR